MNIAALIAWVITALGGFHMLGTWLSRGGARGGSHLPVPVVFGHFALAAVGLVVWIVRLITGLGALAWIAFVLLVPVALLGFVMLTSLHLLSVVARTGKPLAELASVMT
ncbi:hypothetical protein ACFQ08_13820, partial [Streptosporangium algeriense]